MEREKLQKQLGQLRTIKRRGFFRDPQEFLYWRTLEDGICGAFGMPSPPLKDVPRRDYDGVYKDDDDLIECERQWLMDDTFDNVFSFRYLCEHFSIDYKNIRQWFSNHNANFIG